MLHLERRELALQYSRFGARLDLGLQALHLTLELSLFEILNRRAQHLRQAQAGCIRHRLELSITVFLFPAGQHERMNVQSIRHVLRLDLWVKREPYRLNLELVAIPMNLLRTDRRCHFFSLER
jgi:hypothetical protein